MGQIIRKYGLVTHITQYCISACNGIFAGGHFRSMNDNAYLALHSFGRVSTDPSGYYTKRQMNKMYQQNFKTSMDIVYHYLTMGISIEIVKKMSVTPIYEIYYMYKSEAKRLNFVNK